MHAVDPFAVIPFMRALAPRDREVLRAASTIRRFARAALVFREHDPSRALTFVIRGRVKLTKTAADGESAIMQTSGPGHLICLASGGVTHAYCCSCVAMEEGTEVVDVPRAAVTATLDAGNGAASAFMGLAGGCASAWCQRIEVLGTKTVERRIARLLVTLAEGGGVALAGGGTRVPVALSRQDVASLCCTTTETASRVMSAFRRAGLVRQAARGFVIDDLTALRARAQR